MQLISQESIHGIDAGQTFDVDGAEACRLIAYGYAIPASEGRTRSSNGPGHSTRWSAEHAAAVAAVRADRARRQNRRHDNDGPEPAHQPSAQ